MPDANFIIQSSDGVKFRVHKSFLAMASPFFRDLLSRPQPSDGESVDGLPVVKLSEDAELLNSLISMLYPVRAATPKSYDKVLYLLAACQKYDMAQVQSYIREKVKRGDFPTPGVTKYFGAFAIARSKGLIPEMEEAARWTLYRPMTFESLGEGLRLFEGSALRDLAQFRKRCRNDILTCLESCLDVHAPGHFGIWLGCPDVTLNRSESNTSPQNVLPTWLCQLISRINNRLKLRAFTGSLCDIITICGEYSKALQGHSDCNFCSGVAAGKGSTFSWDLWSMLFQAHEKVPIFFIFGFQST